MATRIGGTAALILLVAAAAAAQEQTFVTVTPEVMPAASVVPEIVFEVDPPVDAPLGSRLEIRLPYLYGQPQIGKPDEDNYYGAEFPKGVTGALAVAADAPRDHILQMVVTCGVIPAHKKFKLYLRREHIHPFSHADQAYTTVWFGPPDEQGKEVPIARAQSTVVHHPGGPPHHLRVVGPTCLTPGEAFAVKVAVLDVNNNEAGTPWTGKLSFAGAGVAGPAAAELTTKSNNYVEAPGFAAAAAGVYRISVKGGALAGESNPLVCRAAWDRRIFWGDIHGHSAFSDGMRQPDEYLDYARYVGLLDMAVLTDHAECMYENAWPDELALVRAKNDPPRFTVLEGYEWTSDAWGGGWGHRNVYFRGDGGEYFNCNVDGARTPRELESHYQPGDVIVVPHHPLAGLRWEGFNPAYDRAIEIVSHWGCSEYEGNPLWHGNAWKGGGVVDQLNAYYLLGFVGGGDNHNGAPGQNHGPSRFPHMWYWGGLTAFEVNENNRDALWQAMFERHVYATAGNRDFLELNVDGRPMGEVIPVGRGGATPLVEAEVATEDALASVEVVRGGATAYVEPDVAGSREATFSWHDGGYDGTPTYYYLRVRSQDDHLAFATPVWVSPGTWAEGAPLELAAGAALPLPEPAAEPDHKYAVRVVVTAGAPGILRVEEGIVPVGMARYSGTPGPVIVPFQGGGGAWKARLVYEGSGALAVEEAATFPFPWLNPK